ncbi:hypothetical protein HMPREF3223_00245 [Cutibacterium avidum]|nr:hypothetical protein HMPREF3223_00245 [Cutibacterium avidum]
MDKFSLDVDGAEIADCYHGNFPVPWRPRYSIGDRPGSSPGRPSSFPPVRWGFQPGWGE